MFFNKVAIAALCGSVVSFAGHAATYDPGKLTFATYDPQNVWGAGNALEIKGTYFAGGEWKNKKVELSKSAGSVITVPDPVAFAQAVAASAKYLLDNPACILNDSCLGVGSESSYTKQIDLRTSFKGTLESSGKAGLDLNYKLSAGSWETTFDYAASANVPDAVKAGEAFQIKTNAALTGGTLTSQSPTVEASVDAVLQLEAKVSAQGCIPVNGCSSYSSNVLSVNEDRELISADLNKIKYLGGFLPDGTELSTSLLNQTATMKAGVLNFVEPVVYVEVAGLGAPPGHIVATDVGEIEFTVPKFTATGGVAGDHLALNATSDFISVKADLDTLFATRGVGWPGGGETSIGPVSLSLDAYDFDAGPTFDVFQDLTLTPRLKVYFDFSELVEIGGELVSTFYGAWDSLPEMKVFKPTTFMPEFAVDAIVTSKTGLQVGLELSMEFLKATLGVSIGGFNLPSLGLGPVYEQEFAYKPDWAKIPLFSDSFYVDNLTFMAGKSFVVGQNLVTPPAPVPLPAPIWLLMAGLGSLGIARRRGGGLS